MIPTGVIGLSISILKLAGALAHVQAAHPQNIMIVQIQ